MILERSGDTKENKRDWGSTIAVYVRGVLLDLVGTGVLLKDNNVLYMNSSSSVTEQFCDA